MTSPGPTALAVLGSPIAHSLSPTLHTAAYRELGLDWSYDAVDVPAGTLRPFLDARGPEWRGLSLTMPLKREVIPLLNSSDALVELTGVANTVLLRDGERHGFNTDVDGIVAAFRENQVDSLHDVVILGGGATAASALVACHRLGAASARVWMRNPERAVTIRDLASTLDIDLEVCQFASVSESSWLPQALISTLPNGSTVDLVLSRELRRDSVLLDVAYEPWPTALAESWIDAGGHVISGLEMLINQALMQVRIFVSGDAGQQLEREGAVLAAMRASVTH